MDRERASASEAKIPEAWIGQEVMIETTEALSSDLRAAAPVYLEEVNDKGIVMLVTRHHGQSQFSRYFYPWSVVVLPLECGWLDTSCRGGRALRAASYGFMSPSRLPLHLGWCPCLPSVASDLPMEPLEGRPVPTPQVPWG